MGQERLAEIEQRLQRRSLDPVSFAQRAPGDIRALIEALRAACPGGAVEQKA